MRIFSGFRPIFAAVQQVEGGLYGGLAENYYQAGHSSISAGTLKMATKYRLTWRTEQGGRWRKKYKKKSYYFRRLPDETKEESYRRCVAEWERKKAELDRQQEAKMEPYERALLTLIARTKAQLAELQSEDTPKNRREWSFREGQLRTYQHLFDNGVDPFLDTDDLANPPESLPGWGGDEEAEPPPWEIAGQAAEPGKTLQENVKRFLQRKESQAKRGERSVGRVDVLRVGLESLIKSCGNDQPISVLTTAVLSRFRDELERLVDDGKLRPLSARDRLQAVKQFVRWAWEEELIGLPRILQSRDFAIKISEQRIETFTDVDVRRLLDASSETTKLYLLLMLNCGMTQQDIAELRQDEVDWKRGRVTRRRSKTRKNSNGKNAPEVSYKLWPETFRLMKEHRSEDAQLALTNQNGTPLKIETIENGKVKKIDNIRSAYCRVIRKLANAKTNPVKIDKPLKLLRKTAATKLGEHSEYGRFAQFFLGHAPTTVADKYYVAPAEKPFDEAIAWLRTQFLGRRRRS